MELGLRVLPVLAFLVLVTCLAELADEAGVFDVAAHAIGRLARGRVRVLVLLLVALATATTVVLSIDTTAVLLTPAVIAVALQLRLPAVPLALLTLWLANTASMLLPISNLTNLLAWQKWPSTDVTTFLALTWLPAIATVAATVLVFLLFHARGMPRSYDMPERPAVADRVNFAVAAVACLLLGPLVVLGVAAWAAALVVTAPVLCVVGLRARHVFRRPLIPWRAVGTVSALFLALGLLQETAFGSTIAQLASPGTGLGDLVRTAVAGAASANVVNNLPAFLALEPGVGIGGPAVVALLVGVNCGALVTVWGSLATILWRDRCRSAGLSVGVGTIARQGSVVAVATVAAGVGALALVVR
jgi:arsenical pump membrane protein